VHHAASVAPATHGLWDVNGRGHWRGRHTLQIARPAYSRNDAALASFPFDAEPKRSNHRLISMASPNQGAPEQRPVLSKVEARQGVTGHNVRYMLWFGLAAVIVAFAAIYLFYFD
jgi:cytochrome oxidase assembly protein ShyY1